LGLYEDETAELCQWHVPEAHFLEAWSDARAFDGTGSIIQPLIAPLYSGKSAHELLAVFSDQPERSAYDMVRDTWRRYWEGHERSGEFEQFWEAALHDGIVAGTALPSKSVSLQEGWADRLNSAPGEKSPSPAAAAANA